MEKKREWHGETKFTRMEPVRLPSAEWEKSRPIVKTNGKAYTDVVRFALRDYLNEPEDDGRRTGAGFFTDANPLEALQHPSRGWRWRRLALWRELDLNPRCVSAHTRFPVVRRFFSRL